MTQVTQRLKKNTKKDLRRNSWQAFGIDITPSSTNWFENQYSGLFVQDLIRLVLLVTGQPLINIFTH